MSAEGRSFKKTAAAALICAVVVFLCLNRLLPDKKAEEAQGDYFFLGTVVHISVYGQGKDFLGEELAGLEAEGKRLEKLFSANIPDSDVRRASDGQGKWVEVSEETYALVKRAVELSEDTDGAFDPALGRITKLWKIGSDGARVPEEEEISAALRCCGCKNIALKEEDGAYFIKVTGGALIDLGGIAKGRVADIMVKKLADDGIKSALIDLGGNLAVTGERPGGGKWRLGIQTPERPRGEYFGTVSVSDCSVVTSGAYERYLEKDGVRYHHIFDPSTGRPADSDFSSVTVIDRDSTKADALSTALFVMGRDGADGYLKEHKDIAAVFLLKGEKRVLVTEAARSVFTAADASLSVGGIGGTGK